MIVLSLKLLLLIAVVLSVQSAEEGDLACKVPPPQDVVEEAKRPKKKRGVPNLSADQLDKWGPISIRAVISCEGRVVDPQIPSKLTEDLQEKIRENLNGWRYRPAEIDGRAIAVPFTLILSDRRPSRGRQDE